MIDDTEGIWNNRSETLDVFSGGRADEDRSGRSSGLPDGYCR